MVFKFVGNAGVPVGPPIEIRHFTLHDMREAAVLAKMTDLVLLEGLQANAVEVVKFKRRDEHFGITTIQPRWIEQDASA